MRRPNTSIPLHARRARLVASASVVLVIAALAAPVAASGPVVTFGPAGPLPTGTQTITVTGQGFDPVGNQGNGVYLVYGPITPAPGFYMDPSIYAAFKWIHPTGQDSAAEAPLGADGSFTTTLDIPSSFVSPTGPVDCAVVACAVITFGAHGSQDRTQDTCTAVTFLPGDATASAGPLMSGAPVAPTAQASAAAPSGSAVPMGAAASNAPGDPCAVITAAP